MIKIGLAGNPNSGKTTLFNSLTGSSAHVGNWPGVTVEKRSGYYKTKDRESIEIVDLPGIYSLSPYSPEEVISRHFIIDEKPDCVINIVDTTNLERNLYLTTQLLEIDVPVVVALNLIDVVKKSGDQINPKVLEKELGVPVIPISALKDKSFEQLISKSIEAAKSPRKGRSVLKDKSPLSHLIGDVTIALRALKVDNPLFHAINLIQNDPVEVKMHPQVLNMVDEYKKTVKDEIFGSDLEAVIADRRYKYIENHYSLAYVHKLDRIDKDGKAIETKSDKIDRVLTNKYASILIFFVILFLIFEITFSENLFFLGRVFESHDVQASFAGIPVLDGLFWTEGGINSPGVILQVLVENVTGELTEWIAEGLEGIGANAWSVGLLCDGVLSGIFAVFSFVPQILLLFLFLSILEDTGYMARIAFIFDKIFKKFGLSGRAILPMIMGFGCSVPAMIATRSLANENEKTTTVRVIPFFSCGAKLPVLVAISGALAHKLGFSNVGIITFGMYVLGIAIAIITSLFMRNTIMRGQTPPFIMELPTYHRPRFKSLMVHLWDKLKHYIEKAFTIILLSTIFIWFVLHFRFDWSYIEYDGSFPGDPSESIIAGFGKLVEPLFAPLGFGRLASNFGWIFVVVAISGLIAKENVLATLSVIATVLFSAAGGDDPYDAKAMTDLIVNLIDETGISLPGLLSFMTFNLLTIPCFAAVATAKAELTKKEFWPTIAFWLITSYVVSAMSFTIVNRNSWWSVFIWAGLIALTCVSIYFYNKKHPLEEVRS